MNIEGVDKYMPRVREAIERYIKWPSPEFTDIYNRAYEAVAEILTESQQENQRLRIVLDGILKMAVSHERETHASMGYAITTIKEDARAALAQEGGRDV